MFAWIVVLLIAGLIQLIIISIEKHCIVMGFLKYLLCVFIDFNGMKYKRSILFKNNVYLYIANTIGCLQTNKFKTPLRDFTLKRNFNSPFQSSPFILC